MKKLLKTIIIVAAFSLIAGNGWALSTIAVDDRVIMTAPNDGEHYLMSDTDGDILFNSFCLEYTEFFTPGNTYKVDSIEQYADGGGTNYGDVDPDTGGDPVSDESLWLYASYFDGILGDRSASLAYEVQRAIWYLEDEIADATYYNAFIGTPGVTDFSVTGWDIQVINLVDGATKKQSQLVGAPVPEPTTMLLFGTGLIGLAGVGRRRSSKK